MHVIKEKFHVTLECNSKTQKWAYDNARTLIFLTLMFGISWIITIIALHTAGSDCM